MISAAVHPGVYAGNRTKFFEGLSNYLKTYSYGNAESTDLWTALGEVRVSNAASNGGVSSYSTPQKRLGRDTHS